METVYHPREHSKYFLQQIIRHQSGARAANTNQYYLQTDVVHIRVQSFNNNQPFK